MLILLSFCKFSGYIASAVGLQFHLRKVERPGLQGQSGFDLHGPGRSEQVADGEIIVFGTVCREPLRRGLGKLPNESPASAYGIVERVERIGNFLHEECGRHHLPRSPHVDLCQRTDQAERLPLCVIATCSLTAKKASAASACLNVTGCSKAFIFMAVRSVMS